MRSGYFSSIFLSGLILSGTLSTFSLTGGVKVLAQEDLGVIQVNADEAEKMILEKPSLIVLDVRTLEEVKSTGQLHRAQTLDVFENDFDAKLKKLDIDQPVLVYCAMGGRSKRAIKKMKELGFRKVFELQGGLKAWREAGKVLEGATTTSSAKNSR